MTDEIERATQAVEAEPDSPGLHARLSEALLRAGQVGEAEKTLRNAVRLAPNVGGYHIALSRNLYQQGKVDEALVAAQDACEREPENPNFMIQMAKLLHLKDRAEEAEALYARALQLRPDAPSSHLAISHFLAGQKRWPEAVIAARKAVELDPTDAKLHHQYGRVLAAQGCLKEAAAALSDAVQRSPSDQSIKDSLYSVLSRLPGKHGDDEADTVPKIDKASDVTSIVFVGNCQARLLFHLYKQFAGAAPRQHLTFVMSYVNLSEPDREAMQSAELIVQQVQNFASQVDRGGVQTTAQRILLPVVHCGFLWPFAGQPHPNNPSPPYFEGGPYGAEASDAWLNRMIKQGVEPEIAVARYLELDVNAIVDLDRLYEVTIQKQRERDEATGFEIARIISEHFRDEPIFRTPYHPELRVTLALATQLFEKLDVAANDIERMRRAIRVSPFPATELPIHPAVCRHFGLCFAPDDRRWQFMREGRLTFREFALRYMTGTWNNALEEAAYLAGQGSYRAARKRIGAALKISPASPGAHSINAHILNQLGQPDKAIKAARRAVSIEPVNAGYRAKLGVLLNSSRDKTGAEAEFRAAIELDPFEPHYAFLLAGLLRDDGRLNEAMATLRCAIVISPYSSRLHVALGSVLERIGDRVGAAAALGRACEVDPNNAEAANAHARLLLSSGNAS